MMPVLHLISDITTHIHTTKYQKKILLYIVTIMLGSVFTQHKKVGEGVIHYCTTANLPIKICSSLHQISIKYII